LITDLGLSQIFPVIDEVTDSELSVIHSSFSDPYLLLLREDSSLQILQVDKSGDLDELERGDAALASVWLSGSLYKSEKTSNKTLAFMLNGEGGLAVSVSCSQSKHMPLTLRILDFRASQP
jgi:cleavage and polyadenylation specificity factor subunit 1